MIKIHESPFHRFRYWKIEQQYRYEMMMKVPAGGKNHWIVWFKVADEELSGDALGNMADELWQKCINTAAKGKASA